MCVSDDCWKLGGEPKADSSVLLAKSRQQRHGARVASRSDFIRLSLIDIEVLVDSASSHLLACADLPRKEKRSGKARRLVAIARVARVFPFLRPHPLASQIELTGEEVGRGVNYTNFHQIKKR